MTDCNNARWKPKILTALLLKIKVFSDVILCLRVNTYRRFKEWQCLCLLVKAVEALFLDVFSSEDGGTKTFRNFWPTTQPKVPEYFNLQRNTFLRGER